MFNHWFVQGVIPNSINKREREITLLKKCGKLILEKLYSYWPKTLKNAELKILARILANCLRIAINDLIEPEQNSAVEVRLIKTNLHSIPEVIKMIKNDTEAALISLYPFKTFDKVDHQFLVTVLETTGSEWTACSTINPRQKHSSAVNARSFSQLKISLTGKPNVPYSLCRYFRAPLP